jgi:hypothetical protein
MPWVALANCRRTLSGPHELAHQMSRDILSCCREPGANDLLFGGRKRRYDSTSGLKTEFCSNREQVRHSGCPPAQ